MRTLRTNPSLGNLTRSDMRGAVEAKLRDIQQATAELLQQIDEADPSAAELPRAEASRLNGIGFTLTRLLCHDDIETAYRIVSGDDVDGEVSGLTT